MHLPHFVGQILRQNCSVSLSDFNTTKATLVALEIHFFLLDPFLNFCNLDFVLVNT